MTWSTRRPPELRVHAAISSASGRPACGGEPPGCHGGSVQFWPRWLNSSGGAPTLMPGTITSWRAQASAPPGCAPTARSVITPMLMPARLAACCAAASCSAASHCSHCGTRSGRPARRRAAVTSAEPRVGQRRGPGPPVGTVHLGDARTTSPSPRVARRSRARNASSGPAARGQRHLRGSARAAARLAARTASRSMSAAVPLRHAAARPAPPPGPGPALSPWYSGMSSIRR